MKAKPCLYMDAVKMGEPTQAKSGHWIFNQPNRPIQQQNIGEVVPDLAGVVVNRPAVTVDILLMVVSIGRQSRGHVMTRAAAIG
jgi:hypothetical protein